MLTDERIHELFDAELAKGLNGRLVRLARAIETEVSADKFDMAAHLARQREWSERTFGPDARVNGIVSHIRKELDEIIAAPEDLSEWIDVVILALDGAWRAGYSPDQIIAALVAKQTKNEGRQWPDWRTVAPDTAIEHVREPGEVRAEAQPPAPCPNCCGQEPDDLRLRDEYIKAEKEIERLQARVSELEKDQSQRCPDCKARANGYSVLVPSAELKKLQARVAELEADNQKRYGTIGELSQKVADQAAEIERMKSYADDADTCIKEAKTVIAQQAEQLASAIAAIKDAESLHRIDRNAYVGEIAQQAERIAALEADNKAAWATADRHMTERNEARERIAELEKQCEDQCISCKWPCWHKDQAALIEQCEAEFFHIKKVCLSEFGLSLVNENVLAAIAAHKSK